MIKSVWSKRVRYLLFGTFALIVTLIAIPMLVYEQPPLPQGIGISGYPVKVDAGDIRLIIDSTSFDPGRKRRVIDQGIFDEMLSMIKRADMFIYVDFFLWNPWQGSVREDHRALSWELAEALITKKRFNPSVHILVLTDPINRIYGHYEPELFGKMANAGIAVVFADLEKMQDSNPLAAALLGFYGRPFRTGSALGSLVDRPVLSNPFTISGPPITIRQMSRLLMFKANHRKVMITGSSDRPMELVVGSMNPADGSSAHSNIALHISGRIARTALFSELKVVEWSVTRQDNVSGGEDRKAAGILHSIREAAAAQGDTGSKHGNTFAEWHTESAIAARLSELLDVSGRGDEIRIALFYLSDRKIVSSIKDALGRGASVRMILDANKDAFGREKIGIPNRTVAAELVEYAETTDIMIRWADTHGEQFHTKAISITNGKKKKHIFMTGSANWTRRNLRNYNLEANVVVRNAPAVTGKFNNYFDKAWSNADGMNYTLPYDAWEVKGFARLWKTALYRFQEWSGICTF